MIGGATDGEIATHQLQRPGRIYTQDGKLLIDVKDCDFEDITTTPGPGPAGDVRYPTISAMKPIELHLTYSDPHRRLFAALVLGWRAKGPARWIAYERALRMTRKKKKRSELF